MDRGAMSAIIPSQAAPLATLDTGGPGDAWGRVAVEWLKTRKSDRTRQTYAQALAAFFAWVQAAPGDVTRGNVADYARQLAQDGKADATIAAHLAALSAFYKYAQTEGLTDHNPVAGVPRPSVEPYGKAISLTRDQAAQVLRQVDRATVEGRRDYAMLVLELTTGIRRAELVNIHRRDLADTPAGDVTLTYRPKGGDEVTRPLPRRAVGPLREYLADRGELTPAAPVFVAHDRGAHTRPARPLTAEAWRLIVTKYTQAALGFRVHPHALRHTAASAAWEQTRDLKQVQKLLGHKHALTTQRYIDHVEDARARLGDDLAAAFGVGL